MEYFVLYIVFVLDNVKSFMTGAAVAMISTFGVIAAFIYAFIRSMQAGKADKSSIAGLLVVIVVVVSIQFVSALLPTTKQAAFIVGGGQIYKILTSDQAKELSADTYTILQGLTKEYADEFRKKKETKDAPADQVEKDEE